MFTRIGEERKDEEWGGGYPSPDWMFWGRADLRGFHNIMRWSWSSFKLCLNGQILWVFLLYWFVVESHYSWEFSHAHFQSSIVVVDCSWKKLRIASWKHYCLKWNHSTLKAWIIFMVIESIRHFLFAIHIKS